MRLTFNSVFWAFNGHVHTVISSFGEVKRVEVESLEIETPDDDFLEIDIINLKNENPVVALFHGLEGSSQRFYIRNLMYDLKEAGYSSVALNFRGCGTKMNKQKRMYHSGETSDYIVLFDWISQHFLKNPLFAVGFSLGGNALIKSLGELRASHPVQKAVAVSPPYDLKKGSINMEKGFNKIYGYRFLRTLVEKVNQKQLLYPETPSFTGNTIYEFDDQITAKVHGFKNADHYYEKCSSKHFFEHVRKPLLVIHSKEDTLCPLKFAPFKIIENNSAIKTIFTNRGGHVGFISSPRNWLNKTIIEWLES